MRYRGPGAGARGGLVFQRPVLRSPGIRSHEHDTGNEGKAEPRFTERKFVGSRRGAPDKKPSCGCSRSFNVASRMECTIKKIYFEGERNIRRGMPRALRAATSGIRGLHFGGVVHPVDATHVDVCATQIPSADCSRSMDSRSETGTPR